jgi:hypothetical protein
MVIDIRIKMSKNILGKKIKDYREFRQNFKRRPGSKANLDQKQLEKIEEKGFMPSLGHLIKISRALGVSVGNFSR